jgi:hypothetical protein
MKQSKGLGDRVESVIDTILPKNSNFRKAKVCENCNKRKEKLNRFGEKYL